MTVVVENLDRLNHKLARMTPASRKRLNEALNKNADQLLAAQRALAQRNRRTGKTLESLKKEQGEHDLQVKVFSDYFGARFEEFGTVKMAAIPFFFPPYRLLRKKFKSVIASAIRKAVKEAIHGGG